MAFVLEDESAVFTGDNVLGHGTAVFESLAEYLTSLSMMIEKGGENGKAYPGHGDVIGDRNAKIEEYIRHRRQREREVLSALVEEDGKDGKEEKQGKGDGKGKTAMEVVKVVYKDYPKELWAPAKGGVMQILWYVFLLLLLFQLVRCGMLWDYVETTSLPCDATFSLGILNSRLFAL